MDLTQIKQDRTKMILKFSVPSIIAMVLTALITIADGFFMGNYVGKEGIAAVNLGLPIIYLYLGTGLMVSIGEAAVCSAVLSLIMLFCFEPMLSFLHADRQVAMHFEKYYRIMLLELPVMVVNSAFGLFIRGDGNPGYYMKTSVLNVVLNIVLDYLFAGYMGKVFIRSVLNGSSEFIGEISTGITMFAYNLVIMRRIGVDGVTAFTIAGYVAYAFSMIVIGFGQGASPLISFCYGAEEKSLAADIRRRTNRYVFAAGAFVFLVMAAGTDWYSHLFVQNEKVQKMIQEGMLIFMISCSRGLVVILVCIFVLPALFGMTGVWMAAPVTEGVTLLLTGFFLCRENTSTALLK